MRKAKVGSGGGGRRWARVEALEGRALFSVPPGTPMDRAVVSVENVQGLLTDPARGDLVYMLSGRRVVAIDTGAGAAVAHQELPADGASMAVSPDGSRLYVSVPGAIAIEVLSLPDLAPVGRFGVPYAPASVAAGVGGQVYYSTYGGQEQSLMQLDTATGAVVSRASLWGSSQLRTSPDGTRLFRAQIDGGSGWGAIVDEYLVTGAAPVRVAGYTVYYSNSQDFEVDVDDRRVFTANGGVYGVGVTDMDSGYQYVWSFGGSPYGVAVALSPDGKTIYGASAGGYNGVIQGFDVRTGVLTVGYSTLGLVVGGGLLAATANGHVLYAGRDHSDPGGGPMTLVLQGGGPRMELGEIPVARWTSSVENGVVTFDGRASVPFKAGEPIVSYEWEFADGQVLWGAVVQRTFTSLGSYGAKLRVTTTTGAMDDSDVTVGLSVRAKANGPYSVASGGAVTLSAAGSRSDLGPVVKYEWDTAYDGVTFRPVAIGEEVAFSAAGVLGGTSRAVALRVTDSAGNQAVVSDTVAVANVAPWAELTGSSAPKVGRGAARFTVTFRDEYGIDLATIADGGVRVTGPYGYERVANVAHVTASGTDASVVFEVAAPVGGWDGAANGRYTVWIADGAVFDAAGAAVGAGGAGSFDVALPPPDAPDLRVAFVGSLPAGAVSGGRLTVPVRVANAGSRAMGERLVSVRLFASSDAVLDEGDVPLGAVTRRVALAKGASQVWSVNVITPYVREAGRHRVLARVESVSPLKERDSRNNWSAAVGTLKLVRRPADLAVEFRVWPARYRADQYVDARFRLTNRGASRAAGLLPVRVYATAGAKPGKGDRLVLSTSFNINLGAGERVVLPAYFPAPASMVGKSVLFYLVIDGKAVGDANARNDVSLDVGRVRIV